MSYVPIVTHMPQPPSPRTRELADQIAQVMVAFEEAHPTVTKSEVRRATQLALRATRGSELEVVPVVLMVALLIGVIAYMLVAAG